MTTANEEFADLLPHRISVKGKTTNYDDDGVPVNNKDERIYMCLIDDSTTTTRDASGTEITTSLTAYVAPVPLMIDGQANRDESPVDIESDEIVHVINPRPEVRLVSSIERHYDSEDGVGMLHNITLKFT